METQAGFSKGNRMEDNLFILQYCVEESYSRNKALIVIAIDFTKAFDSIKREKMIEVMKKYKIHWQIIDAVANIYSGDSTEINFWEERSSTSNTVWSGDSKFDRDRN